MWLLRNPLKTLIFYGFPCSESHFLDTLVPNLKNSLSISKTFPSTRRQDSYSSQ
ncbi:anthocyanin 5-aromatic acyltransferase [Phtheirospermum japonicum]|uniref:Anthocyanin 5-aromatic acyltransferase n=1 Tax=Phtheirospermum japonicum TaxID=374723 RepID=A0A830BHY5_9LAMI|nr:anthocyanin 5-aromatic acyltransferase [Phtheirospermum japonicum]